MSKKTKKTSDPRKEVIAKVHKFLDYPKFIQIAMMTDQDKLRQFFLEMTQGLVTTNERYETLLIMSTFLHENVTKTGAGWRDLKKIMEDFAAANTAIITGIEQNIDEGESLELLELLKDQRDRFNELVSMASTYAETSDQVLDYFTRMVESGEEHSFIPDFREAQIFFLQAHEAPDDQDTLPDSEFDAGIKGLLASFDQKDTDQGGSKNS